jgi:hypothetical protein
VRSDFVEKKEHCSGPLLLIFQNIRMSTERRKTTLRKRPFFFYRNSKNSFSRKKESKIRIFTRKTLHCFFLSEYEKQNYVDRFFGLNIKIVTIG